MQDLLNFLSGISITVYVTIFGLIVSTIFTSFMCVVIIRATHNKDLSRLVIDDTTGKLSQHKFWSNIAFILTSVAFVKYNFEAEPRHFIVELWVIYLTAFAGTNMFNAYLKQRTREKNMQYTSIETQEHIRLAYENDQLDEKGNPKYTSEKRPYQE